MTLWVTTECLIIEWVLFHQAGWNIMIPGPVWALERVWLIASVIVLSPVGVLSTVSWSFTLSMTRLEFDQRLKGKPYTSFWGFFLLIWILCPTNFSLPLPLKKSDSCFLNSESWPDSVGVPSIVSRIEVHMTVSSVNLFLSEVTISLSVIPLTENSCLLPFVRFPSCLLQEANSKLLFLYGAKWNSKNHCFLLSPVCRILIFSWCLLLSLNFSNFIKSRSFPCVYAV